jgi:hypothetical protein
MIDPIDVGEPTLADLVEDVCRQVPATVPRRRVIATVRRCRRELDIMSGSAHPDRIRHLALRRLRGEPA